MCKCLPGMWAGHRVRVCVGTYIRVFCILHYYNNEIKKVNKKKVLIYRDKKDLL